VHALSQLHLDLLECGPHAVASALSLELEGSAPGLAAYEDEPQEGKRLWLAEPALLSTRRGKATELKQTGFVSVQLKRELREPFAHRIPELPRIGLSLEARHDVVSVAHDDHLARGLSLAPLRRPEVKDVVQKNVGQQRRRHAMDTKGNFEFERRVALQRTRLVLDLRRKK
jgi:hypothetical protein